MSDQRLRQLERRWRETGATHDEAAFLLERVRTGQLDQENLALAAYCGNTGAMAAMEEAAPERPDGLEEWVRGLARWRFGLARAAETAADLSLPIWAARHPDDSSMQTLVVKLRTWIARPDSVTLVEAQQAAASAYQTLDQQLDLRGALTSRAGTIESHLWAATSICTAAGAVSRDIRPGPRYAVESARTAALAHGEQRAATSTIRALFQRPSAVDAPVDTSGRTATHGARERVSRHLHLALLTHALR